MRRFLLPLLLVGCGSDRSPGASALADHLVATEDFRIGADAVDLTGASWMLVRDDGSIFIPQSKDNLIKVIAPDTTVSTIGRSGEGPGEFSRLTRIGWIGDSIWTLDPSLKRVTIFGPDFDMVRSFPEPHTVSQGADGSGSDSSSFEVYPQALLPGGGMRILVSFRFGLHLPAWSPPVDSGVSLYVRTDQAGQFEEVLGEAPRNSCFVSYTFPKGMGSARRPICDQPLSTGWDGGAAVAYSSTVHADSGSYYQVKLVDSEGETVFERAIAFTPIPVTSEATDSVLAAIAKARGDLPPAIRDAMPTLEPDPTFPPVRRLVLGRDEGVWVEEETRLPGHHWRYLDPTGQPRFSVDLPASVTLMAADSAHIWGTDEDTDGLLSVVRYRLEAAPDRP